MAGILSKYGDVIRSEVLADRICTGQTGGYTKEWNINGEKTVLGVEKTSEA